MINLSTISIALFGIIINPLFIIAAPFLTYHNNGTDTTCASCATPTIARAASAQPRALTTNIPILTAPPPTTSSGPNTNTGIPWVASYEPLKALEFIRKQPSKTNGNKPTSSRAPSVYETKASPISTAAIPKKHEIAVNVESTSLALAHVPVKYVYKLPRSITRRDGRISRRHIDARTYITHTQVVSHTVMVPAYVVTKTTSLYRLGPTKTTVTSIRISPLRSLLSRLLPTPTKLRSGKPTITIKPPRSTKPTKTLKLSKIGKATTRPTHLWLKPAPTNRDNPKCNGLFRYDTNQTTDEQYKVYYYFDYAYAVDQVNKYCRDIQSLPDNYNRKGIRRVQIGAVNDRNAFTMGVYWPPHIPGTKPQPEICVYYLKSLLLDGCDGNDPDNPLNWKGGGTVYAVDQDGTYRRQIYYTIQAVGRRNSIIKERRAQCYRQVRGKTSRIYLQGAGWAGDASLSDIKEDINRVCGKILQEWQATSLVEHSTLYEWGLNFLIPKDQEVCVLDVIRRNFGMVVECPQMFAELGGTQSPWNFIAEGRHRHL